MSVTSLSVPDSISRVLTVDTNQQFAVTSMFYCNTTDDDSILDVYIVRSGSTPSNLNKIIHKLTISPGDTFTFDTEKIILDSGDSIQALCIPASGISCTVSYVRVA
jgi:hypothetical protein